MPTGSISRYVKNHHKNEVSTIDIHRRECTVVIGYLLLAEELAASSGRWGVRDEHATNQANPCTSSAEENSRPRLTHNMVIGGQVCLHTDRVLGPLPPSPPSPPFLPPKKSSKRKTGPEGTLAAREEGTKSSSLHSVDVCCIR